MIDLAHERPLSIARAAQLLRVPPRTIKEWFGRGLGSVRLGGLIYTTREAIQRFAEPVTTEAGPPVAAKRSHPPAPAPRPVADAIRLI